MCVEKENMDFSHLLLYYQSLQTQTDKAMQLQGFLSLFNILSFFFTKPEFVGPNCFTLLKNIVPREAGSRCRCIALTSDFSRISELSANI